MKIPEIYAALQNLRARIREQGHSEATRDEVRRLGDLAAEIFEIVAGDPQAAFAPELRENRGDVEGNAFFHHPHVIEDVLDYAVRRGFAELEVSTHE